MKNLRGKTAFITGGASGLGLGIAKAAAEEGMRIVLADLNRSTLSEALNWFHDNSHEAIALELNVADREAYKEAEKEATSKFGNIHLLCNNAGIGARGLLWEVGYENMDLAVDINLKGVLNGVRTIVPGMLAHGEGGHIVSTASKAALLPPLSLTGLYALTKSAVVTLSETLATQLPDGYGASAFCPGPFATNLGKNTVELHEQLKGIQLPEMHSAAGANETNFITEAVRTEAASRVLPPETAGRLVIRGVMRGDLYILTHSEFYEGTKARLDAILRAFPKDSPNESFKRTGDMTTYNPIFMNQREYI